MGIDQFSERNPAKMYDLLDDSATPSAYSFIGFPSSTLLTRWDVVRLVNTDTIDHNLVFTTGTDDQGCVGGVTVPAAVGGVPGSVDLLAALLPAAQQFTYTNNAIFYFAQWKVLEAINPGAHVVISATGGSF